MTVRFSRSAQREQQELLTLDRILFLARQKGRFCVSWRYRDDWLRKRCGKLVKQGLLRRVPYTKGENEYEPVYSE